MLLEILIVLLLTMFNGVLAMSELAIVSARPARLKVMAAEGSRGAEIALDLGTEPGRFLSSVQIGITLVGVLSGAISGATLGARLSALLIANGLSPALSQALGVGGVVVLRTGHDASVPVALSVSFSGCSNTLWPMCCRPRSSSSRTWESARR